MNENILAIARRVLAEAEKATPRPWRSLIDNHSKVWSNWIETEDGQRLICDIRGHHDGNSNSNYIVAAANAAPLLAAEVIRLRERIIDLEDQTGIADNVIRELEAQT
jgi:hypothetical protein